MSRALALAITALSLASCGSDVWSRRDSGRDQLVQDGLECAEQARTIFPDPVPGSNSKLDAAGVAEIRTQMQNACMRQRGWDR